MRSHPVPRVLAAATAGCALALAGCSASSSASGSSVGIDAPTTIEVNAGDTTCDVSTTTLAAGRHTFQISNSASQVNELYVYAAGDQIVGEVENVGPATQRTLIVDLAAGSYQVTCKPGMVGDGIRTALTVTGAAAPSQSLDQNLQAAVDGYRSFVESEAQALADTTTTFTAAITTGDLAQARLTYAQARLHYERIEPIAESFGELDPLIDMRIDDAGNGTPFVGFHALEQLIFEGNTLTGAGTLATELNTNVGKLNQLVKTVEITPLSMGNGAKSLLDEVAKSKVTGEEERYSRIDLLDFAGNVDGAKYVYTSLRSALLSRDPDLVATLDTRFAALSALLATHQATESTPGYIPGSPYVSYDTLTADEIRALAVEVDAISEPIGRISGVVTGR